MRNILVLAYYFPPMAFSGVQRIAKFVKYLPDFGIQPTVLTIDPHAYFAFDDELLGEIEARNIEIWRTSPGGPHAMMPKKKTVSLANERMRKILNRISQSVFVPDNKVSWGKHVLQFLESQDLSQFEAVLCTGPPFSLFGTGAEIKRRYGLPLILDFRDAWLEYPYHRYATPWHRRKHAALEQEAVSAADVVVTTNSFVKDALQRRYPNASASFKIVTQGYDEDDFHHAEKVELSPEHVHIVHTGLFYEDRTPEAMFRVIKSIERSNDNTVRGKRLKFHFVGAMQQEFQHMASDMGIKDSVVFHGHVSHAKSVGFLEAADALWFTIGHKDQGFETVAPGKVYEYIGSRKPIVAMSPSNHVTCMLSGIPNATILEPTDIEGATECLLSEQFFRIVDESPHEFSRKFQTQRLAATIRLTFS